MNLNEVRFMRPIDFFDYLRGRVQTRDLALQLAYVYDERRSRRAATAGR